MKYTKQISYILMIGILILIFWLIVTYLVPFFIFSHPLMSQKNIQNDFLRNKSCIENVQNYLLNSNYDTIYIDNKYASDGMNVFEKNPYTGEEKSVYIKIHDQKVLNNLTKLFKTFKDERISKEGNSIYFQRSSNLKRSSGIAYSIDGEKPNDDYLVTLEPLQDKNWFYYIKK